MRSVTLLILIGVLLGSPGAGWSQVLEPAGDPQMPLYGVTEGKNPLLAWALSAALPGLGQLYNGQEKKAALHLGMTGFFLAAAAEYGGMSEEHGVGGLVATWVWSMIDAPVTARAINQERARVSVGPTRRQGPERYSSGLLSPFRLEVRVAVRVPDW